MTSPHDPERVVTTAREHIPQPAADTDALLAAMVEAQDTHPEM